MSQIKERVSNSLNRPNCHHHCKGKKISQSISLCHQLPCLKENASTILKVNSRPNSNYNAETTKQ
ncbi:hypothetical protein T01_4718 [Trichinella spiralis]|uniref:Uncharacterized protein n=1 Tax=Trichinella spiralis TaxID=6334 RepID=A0A0V1C1T0_TRISP|nr:hypothetical protein T01_4718 [Trichinella spiralis]